MNIKTLFVIIILSFANFAMLNGESFEGLEPFMDNKKNVQDLVDNLKDLKTMDEKNEYRTLAHNLSLSLELGSNEVVPNLIKFRDFVRRKVENPVKGPTQPHQKPKPHGLGTYLGNINLLIFKNPNNTKTPFFQSTLSKDIKKIAEL